MNSNRIERKRAHDREAQRVSRARTKAYIAHLEKAVADLSSSNADERERLLALRTSEQEKRIEGLQSTLTKIQNVLKQATEPEEIICDQDSPGSTATISSRRDGRSRSIEETVRTQRALSNVGPEEPACECAAVHTEPMQSERRPFHAYCLGVNLECTESDVNYFDRLTGVLASLERIDKRTKLSDAKTDDDILVRAVIFGWKAVDEAHRLDVVWQFIRAFDEGLFSLMPPVERIAHMRQMRSMLVYKIQPLNQERRQIVKCFVQTALQQSRQHFSLPDYFAWPQVRNHLIKNRVSFISEQECIKFAKNFRFAWPYELRDVFMKHKESGLYSFSDAFNKSYNDLSCYRMKFYDGASAIGFFNDACLSPLTPASQSEDISEHSRTLGRAPESASEAADGAVLQHSELGWPVEDLRWLSEVEVGQWFGGVWAFPTDTSTATCTCNADISNLAPT